MVVRCAGASVLRMYSEKKKSGHCMKIDVGFRCLQLVPDGVFFARDWKCNDFCLV